MSQESREYQEVISNVSDVVNEMYNRYQKKWGLECTDDTERQLDILVGKKYISKSYITDIAFIAKCYERGMICTYLSALSAYRTRVKVQIESIPY